MQDIHFLLLFRLAGLIMVGLVVANAVLPSRFNYAENLKGASLIVRQIFYVHCVYLVLVIAGLGLLCLGWPELLLEEGLAQGFCAFFAFFWLSRVLAQLIYYDKELRAQERFWDVFFILVYTTLGLAFLLPLIA